MLCQIYRNEKCKIWLLQNTAPAGELMEKNKMRELGFFRRKLRRQVVDMYMTSQHGLQGIKITQKRRGNVGISLGMFLF